VAAVPVAAPLDELAPALGAGTLFAEPPLEDEPPEDEPPEDEPPEDEPPEGAAG
jgi:hypothetical protein